jgi:hypothetical protein
MFLLLWNTFSGWLPLLAYAWALVFLAGAGLGRWLLAAVRAAVTWPPVVVGRSQPGWSASWALR